MVQGIDHHFKTSDHQKACWKNSEIKNKEKKTLIFIQFTVWEARCLPGLHRHLFVIDCTFLRSHGSLWGEDNYGNTSHTRNALHWFLPCSYTSTDTLFYLHPNHLWLTLRLAITKYQWSKNKHYSMEWQMVERRHMFLVFDEISEECHDFNHKERWCAQEYHMELLADWKPSSLWILIFHHFHKLPCHSNLWYAIL